MSKKKSNKEKTSQIPETFQHEKQTLVVGIGASAGGIEALLEFFQKVEAGSGLAYVVILHLSPDHDSRLTEILGQVSPIRVIQVTENVQIQADHVYVVPPNQHLHMQNGQILISPNLNLEERRAPVDIFFRSLAESHGPLAVGVILSGTGANGSMGLKRIKENGGAVFVQNPREAVFNEMPRHAIATNLVDDILSVAQIPAKLVSYRNSLGTISIRPEAQMRPEDQQQALREVFTHLRLRTGHDFSNYKRPTLMRRLERRINVRNLPDLPAYAAFLREHPEETQALLKDLLISVTNFFRDRKAFLALEQDIIPILTREQGRDRVIRIWVAGCATGEEAYSLAMLIAEKTMDMIDAPKVQIFATDIDEAAISVAREGRYTLNDAADISPERLSRFLVPDREDFRVRQEIREMILFAHHNVLKDPPFSKIDLVTCRNLLIYFNSAAQERVMETFHFALKPGGYLFLGISETTDGAGDLFVTVSRENHIYQSRPVAIRSYPVPENTFLVPTGKKEVMEVSSPKDTRSLQSRLNFGDLHQQLLEQYAPPSIIVNEEYDILHLSEKAGMYLHMAGGEPSKNLLKLIRPELRLELRTAFYQATRQKINIESPNLQVRIDDRIQSLTLYVRPVLEGDSHAGNNPAKGLFLVIFEPTGQHTESVSSALASEEPLAQQLEEELMRIKAQLKTASKQYETQAEELKASNEELQAMNEELRSAAEELETSKEELQSINEELTTVNQELKIKLEEISVTRNNLQNLINSTDLATLFLDRSLRVNLFTPAARTIFNLIPSDSGRPLTDITNRLHDDHLLQDAQSVLEKLQPVEREVQTNNGQLFMMRVLPYRTAEDHINGVVLTFVDISKRRTAEEAVRQSEERMRLVFESARDYAIFTQDLERHVTSWSPGAHSITGYSDADILGQSGDIIFTPDDQLNGIPEQEVQTTLKQVHTVNERWYMRKDGTRFWGSGSVSPLKDTQGRLLGFVKIMRDLTEQRAAEEARSYLAAIVESSQDAILTVNFDGIITSWNQASEKLYGYSTSQAIGNPLSMLILPKDLDQLLKDTEKIKISEKVETYDTIRVNKDNREMLLEVVMSPVKNSAGQVIGVSTIARDVTDLQRAQQQTQKMAENLQAVLDASPACIGLLKATRDQTNADTVTGFQLAVGNQKLAEFFSEPLPELLGKPADHFEGLLWGPHTLDHLMQVYHSNNPRYDEKYLIADNGQERWLAVAVSRQDDGLVLTGLDITQLKQAQAQQQFWLGELENASQNAQSVAQLREELKERGELLRSASHDLRGQVGVIASAAQLLGISGSENDNNILIQMIQRNVQHMTQLMTSLLDFARLEAAQEVVHLSRFNVAGLLQELVQNTQIFAKERGLWLKANGPMDLYVESDPLQIRRIAQNLLLNALKYTHSGGVMISWERLTDVPGWTFTVVDTGPGLPAGLLARLKGEPQEPVTDEIMAANKSGGEGIGLAIVIRLCTLLGCQLEVESHQEKGTRFEIRFIELNPNE